MNTKIKYSGLFLFFLFFISCGIEEYVYIAPVPPWDITPQGNSVSKEIDLPESSSEPSFFTHYSIYYKIYTSTEYRDSFSDGDYYIINPTLASDYSYLENFTNTIDNTRLPSDMNFLFQNRGYYKISLEGVPNIDSFLARNDSNDITINLEFFLEPGVNPVLTFNNVSYVLHRTVDNPQPDYTFKNSTEIHIIDNQDFNDDVENITDVPTTECYASFYIVKVGIDTNITEIYSSPTFIGIFLLPE
jgi:hypothetical protein